MQLARIGYKGTKYLCNHQMFHLKTQIIMEELKRKSEELRKYIDPVIFNFWVTCPLAKVEDAESQLKYLIEQGAYRSIAMFAEYSLLCLMLGKSVKLEMIAPEVEWACVWD